VTHQQYTKLIPTIRDLVIHDTLLFLKLVLPHLQLVKRVHRGITRTIRVVNRGSVHSLAVLPDRQSV